MMSLNLNLYKNTINTLTNSTLTSDLYLKKLDQTGKLIDVCFLIKLFRIIAHCFGFFTNANAAKELKQAVIRQLTPHFLSEPRLENESEHFESIAAKVEAKINPPQERPKPTPLISSSSESKPPLSPSRVSVVFDRPPMKIVETLPPEPLEEFSSTLTTLPSNTSPTVETSPAINNQPSEKPLVAVTSALPPPAPTPSVNEILAKIYLKQFLTIEETAFLQEQETLDLTNWPKPIVVKLTFEKGPIYADLTDLINRCKKLKTVIIGECDVIKNHKELATLLVSPKYAHITFHAPLLPLIHTRQNRYDLKNHLQAVSTYFIKYGTTPKLRAEILEKTFAPSLSNFDSDRFENIGQCLEQLTSTYPEEVVPNILNNIASLFESQDTNLNLGLYEPIFTKFSWSLYPKLFTALLEENRIKFFTKVLRIHLLYRFDYDDQIDYSILPLLQSAIGKSIKYEVFSLFVNWLDLRNIHEDELQFIIKALEKLNEEEFSTFLSLAFTSELYPLRVISMTPRNKIPLAIAHAARSKPEYHSASINSLLAHYNTRVESASTSTIVIGSLAALATLELIDQSPADLTARLKELYQGWGRYSRKHYPSRLAAFSTPEEIFRIFPLFADLETNTQEFNYHFIKTIIEEDCVDKIGAVFTNYWNFKDSFVVADPEFQFKNCFCEISSLRTLHALLKVLKPLSVIPVTNAKAELANWV